MSPTPKALFIAERVALLTGKNKKARAEEEWATMKPSNKRMYKHMAKIEKWENSDKCFFYYDGKEMVYREKYTSEEDCIAYIKTEVPAFAKNPIPRFVANINVYIVDTFIALDRVRLTHADAFITADAFDPGNERINFHFPTTSPSLEELCKCFDADSDIGIEEWNEEKQSAEQSVQSEQSEQEAEDDQRIFKLIEELVKTTDRATIIAKLTELKK